MHKDWTETTLGEIAEVVGGGTPSTTNPAFWDGEVIWLTPTEVTVLDGKVVSDSVRKITEAGLRGSGARLLPVGTVILTSRASVGFVALAGTELTTNQGFQSLIPNNDVESRFLMFWIQYNRNEFQSRSAGSTFKEISNTNVKSIRINLPSLDEQKRIVDVVSSVDAYIDALQQQAASARVARLAVLHELLSAGGDDWTETTLGQIASLKNGDRGKNYPSANQRTSDGVPFINAGHLVNGKVVLDSMDYIAEETFNLLSAGKIEENDILYCLRGTVGKFGVVEGINRGAIASSLVIVRVGKESMTSFICLFLDSAHAKIQLDEMRNGAVQPNLSASSLASFKVVLPPFVEQERIVGIVSSMDEVIQSTEQAVVEAKALRSGLLSDLLSGNHEVPASYDSLLGVA